MPEISSSNQADSIKPYSLLMGHDTLLRLPLTPSQLQSRKICLIRKQIKRSFQIAIMCRSQETISEKRYMHHFDSLKFDSPSRHTCCSDLCALMSYLFFSRTNECLNRGYLTVQPQNWMELVKYKHHDKVKVKRGMIS